MIPLTAIPAVVSSLSVLREEHGLNPAELSACLSIAIMKSHAWTWSPDGSDGFSGRVGLELERMAQCLSMEDPDLPPDMAGLAAVKTKLEVEESRLRDQIALLAGNTVPVGFAPSDREREAAGEWERSHYATEHPDWKPMGVPTPSKTDWIFTPTSMGTIVSVRCSACGAEQVVSDFSDW